MRKCSVCKKEKELSQFHKNKRFPLGHAYVCSLCFNNTRLTRWKRNPERRHQNYLNNIPRQKNSDLLRWYGITKQQYDDLLAKQDSLCAICGKHASESHKGLHVDHCHETKKVRGLLCNSCNLAIGLLKHNRTVISKAIEYLGQ